MGNEQRRSVWAALALYDPDVRHDELPLVKDVHIYSVCLHHPGDAPGRQSGEFRR